MNPEFERFEGDFFVQDQVDDSPETYWDDDEDDYEYENDGQPDDYTEWQDVYGGDDWDHGQYDE